MDATKLHKQEVERAKQTEARIGNLRKELDRMDMIGFINDPIAFQFSKVREAVDELLNRVDEVAKMEVK